MKTARTFLLAGTLGAVLPLAAGADTPARRIEARSLPLAAVTDERFQSFQIGFSHLTGGETWKSYDSLPKDGAATRNFADVREARAAADLNNPRLLALTKALSPLYIRYSGTTANSVYFHDSDSPPPAKVPDGYTVMLSRKSWKDALRFVKAVDARVISSLANSEGVRDAAGNWTPRMAAPWLAYTRKIGGRIEALELYNEPNAPEPPRIPKGKSPADYARDYAAFSAFMLAEGRGVKRAGPGTATLGIPGVPAIQGITSDAYADADPKPRFDVLSYHFYPTLADRCAPAGSALAVSKDKALSEEFLARPDIEFQRQKALRDRVAPGAPIWLTETGGAACGGLRWQQTYLDMFRFLDTQARLARQGLAAMFTHALISGSNGVIDEKTLEPNASYWGAVVWRKLMDRRVLDAGPQQSGLHVYAHCLRGRSGGVALLALNLKDSADAVDIGGKGQVYALTSADMASRSAMLNGKLLAVGKDNRLPVIAPVAVSGRVALPATSIAFIALPDAGNRQCR